MATMAATVRRFQAVEQAQVQRARRRVLEQKENEAVALPTAERVDAAVRAALAPHLGIVLEVRLRYQRAAKEETVKARLVSVCQSGALCRTEQGCPVWLGYRDLYATHTTVLDPPTARDAVRTAVSVLRRGAPREDR